jgi:hypothetical protein
MTLKKTSGYSDLELEYFRCKTSRKETQETTATKAVDASDLYYFIEEHSITDEDCSEADPSG